MGIITLQRYFRSEVPSTLLALLISVALSSVKALKKLFQTIYFLPYVTNTLAVGLVFMILFKKTAYSDGLINLVLKLFGQGPVDFIDGPYWAKMLVLCIYTIWIVMPFKVLILTSALASVNQNYYNAARVDGTSRFRIFIRITLPMISPTVFYLIITGFIGAFKAYSDAVALFGTDLNAAGMNTIVGYVYDMLYGNGGGYPSYASAAAILLFVIVLTITCIILQGGRQCKEGGNVLCVVGTVAFYRGKKHPVKRKQYDQSPDGKQQVDKDVSQGMPSGGSMLRFCKLSGIFFHVFSFMKTSTSFSK